MAKISFIVSAFERPDFLSCCLYSLKNQTDSDIRVIVVDNAINPDIAKEQEKRVEALKDSRFRYLKTETSDCYHSAAYGVESTMSEFVCFPSDDSYYTPHFTELMLKASAENKWDLVYCDCVYDPGYRREYRILIAAPRKGEVDKTNFIIRREKFVPFDKCPGYDLGAGDGNFIEHVVSKGLTHGRLPLPLLVHV